MPRKNGRNEDGTFAEGNAGGPGRPPRQTEAGYMHILLGSCDLDTWREIVERAVYDAKEGDRYAREWLTRYLVGEPSPTHYAPKPTRVLAQQELSEDDPSYDELAGEKNRLRRSRMLEELY